VSTAAASPATAARPKADPPRRRGPLARGGRTDGRRPAGQEARTRTPVRVPFELTTPVASPESHLLTSTPHSGEDRLQRLFHRVGTGIAVAATDGRFLDVNPAFCATVGYSADELATMSFLELTHPADRPRNLELVATLLDGQRESFTIEKRYLTKDRGPVWVRASVSVLREDGAPPELVATTEDITAHKRVEARLEESQDLLRIAGEVGRVGGWAIDRDPVKLYWSDEVHDLAGYPRGQTPPLDEAFALYPESERQRLAAAVERCLADGVPFDEECAFVPKHGRPLWVRVVGRPRRGPSGDVERIHGAIMDISEQMRSQQRTAELADRLKTTMESITDALYTIDTDWRFTYLNEQAQQVLQRDATGLLGRRIWEEFPATVGTPLEEAYRRAVVENRTVILEEFHYEPLEVYFSVNVYPSEQGLAVYFRDVTEKRADRLELEERGARLAEQAALLDEAQDAIVVRDLDGRISYWNRSAERIYGWTADEVAGRRVDELLGIDPTVYADATEQLLTEGTWVHEVTETTKDGRELVTEARWTLVRDADGEPVSVLGIDTDITERKRIEEQFLRSQRMESIGKLAGGIAHDLNNALVPISASITLLGENERDPLKLRLLDIMEKSARHGADMMDQMLSFARGAEDKREPISIGVLIEEVRRITADTFPKSITVRTEVPDGLWPVVGDPTQIQQVLINLCVNARDAMPEGGTITLSAANTARGMAAGNGRRGAATGSDTPTVSLRVRDTGIGIAPEVRERMFDPFYSTKPRNEGTGLGLSTTAVIVEGHGGHIEVASEPGAGSIFEVHLPAEPGSDHVGANEGTEVRHGAGELVLIVDDERPIRQITRTILEHYGYRVVEAANGRDALEVFDAHPDTAVVLTDLMMPVMDGYELIATLQARAEVPVLATSGLSTTEAAERAVAAGAARFVPKPYDSPRLLGAIAEELGAHRSSR
jgi:two-component system, cell cycle sensor histidine kinase and response regulator CckA